MDAFEYSKKEGVGTEPTPPQSHISLVTKMAKAKITFAKSIFTSTEILNLDFMVPPYESRPKAPWVINPIVFSSRPGWRYH